MDERLQQLQELSILPSRLAGQLADARQAHSELPAPKALARQVLALLSFLADIVAAVAGEGRHLAATWLCAFLLTRLVASTWNLPPGPWWNWTLLLGFDRPSLLVATGLTAALVVVPIVLCVAIGKVLHAYLRDNAAPPHARTLCASVMLVVAVITMMSCSGHAARDPVSGCGNALQPSALGQSWWLLQCPADAPQTCHVTRGDTTVPVGPGHQLIVAADQLRRIDFLPNAMHCASEVTLAGDIGNGVSGPHAPIEVKVQPITLAPVKLEHALQVALDGRAAALFEKLDSTLDGLALQMKHRPPIKLELAGSVRAILPDQMKATLDMPQLAAAVDVYRAHAGDYADASTAAQKAQRMLAVCEMRRKAQSARSRTHLFWYSDPDCLKAIAEAMIDPSVAKGNVPPGNETRKGGSP
jgi:hypothetical protein